MLVARQRTGENRPLTAAAEHLVGVLCSWGPGPNHLTGLALAGITLQSRLGPRRVDALVFTRTGVVVIAAHEPGPVEWPGPGDRTGLAVAAARGALAGHEGGRHVTGLVAVVPPPEPRGDGSASGEQGLRLGEWAAVRRASEPEAVWSEGESDRLPPPRSDRPAPALRWPEPAAVPGVAVVLADPRGLRRIIAQHNRWRTVWSADEVLDACYALSLAHLAPPRAALIADGFPARLPVLTPLPELPAVIPVPAEPPPVVEDDPVPWTPAVRATVFPRPRPIRQVPWGLLFVLTVLVAVGVVAAVFVAQVFHGS
ncbi:hypothetical protein [Amycolatopsis sp. MtRt-6]|uniref:hypothetical protein n=1 Tax=Amycolatopsis sp. MtRt-6 TaxID=2792782 RepID=UPI0027DDC8E9|nr:hypothetical protein [Amycolatopsis sp. MtRt-6]